MGTSFRRGTGRASGLGGWSVALALLTAVLAILALPGGRAAAQEGEDVATNATIRLVHASPGAPEVDVLLDGQPLAEGVAFGAVTDYVPLTPETHQLQVVPAGQTADAAVIDEELEAGTGEAYIFVIRGPLNEIEGEVLDVDLDAVEPGQARVRVIHASPDAEEVDVAVTGGDVLFDGVGFGDATDYQDAAPGTYSFDLRGEEDRVLATVPSIAIEAGQVYDIVAIGQVSERSLNLLSLVTNVSRPCSEVLGLAGTGEDACVRLVHAAIDAADVDVYAEDSPLAQGLAFGNATEYVNLPAGDGRQLRVAAAGTSPDESILDAEVDLEAGQAYQIVAGGQGEELEAIVSEVNLTPLPENQARIRVVHASPDAGNVDVGIAEGPTVVEGIEAGNASPYATVDAGAYTLEVRPAGEDTVAVAVDAEVEAGVAYDAVALGRAEDQTLRVLILPSTAAVREGELATPAAEVETTPGAVETVAPVGTPTEGETDAVEGGEDAAETVEAVETTPTPTPLP
ncbi:MAG: DUF4397 domain-containing protein [Chloroflexota bacterium]|nr:DUF4397 domain-containing protein [Chloroflexota bacterium]